MKFREWLRLDEIQHVILGKPTSINGVIADSIDFRFEDWQKGLNPEKHDGVVSVVPNGRQFFAGSFSAPIRNGWINANMGGGQQMTQGNLGVIASIKPKIEISSSAEFTPLPPVWYDFAILYYGNDVVKTPEWPRNEYEMRAKDVARIEPVA